MQVNAVALDERSIAFVGRFIENLEGNQERNTTGLELSNQAEKSYLQNCASCHGESEDFGVMLELMEGRLVLTGTIYETVSDRESSFPSRNRINAISGINNIYDNLATGDPAADPPIAPFITDAVNDAQRTEGGLITTSNKSEGWEISATANITENWRFIANASYIDSAIANTFSEFTPW